MVNVLTMQHFCFNGACDRIATFHRIELQNSVAMQLLLNPVMFPLGLQCGVSVYCGLNPMIIVYWLQPPFSDAGSGYCMVQLSGLYILSQNCYVWKFFQRNLYCQLQTFLKQYNCRQCMHGGEFHVCRHCQQKYLTVHV